jgi:hypothetical protein
VSLSEFERLSIVSKQTLLLTRWPLVAIHTQQ